MGSPIGVTRQGQGQKPAEEREQAMEMGAHILENWARILETGPSPEFVESRDSRTKEEVMESEPPALVMRAKVECAGREPAMERRRKRKEREMRREKVEGREPQDDDFLRPGASSAGFSCSASFWPRRRMDIASGACAGELCWRWRRKRRWW
jgi:hypothetical protein